MPVDNSCVRLEGPWTHRLLQANGAQFHLAMAGDDDAPLVLLIHGFPQYWWAWRNQIEAFATAGYRVAAIDQRGIGGSDKTPNAEDGLTLTQDIISITQALGARQATLIGLGRGGALAWSALSMRPDLFDGLISVSSPHPRTLQRIGTHVTLKTWRHALLTALRSVSKRTLRNEDSIRRMLESWSAPGNTGASSQSAIYAQAMRLPGAASVAVDQLRWNYLAQQKSSGRAYLRESAHGVYAPVLAIRGELDPLLPARAWDKDREFALGSYERVQVPGVGHFIPEESPEKFNALALRFLDSLHGK